MWLSALSSGIANLVQNTWTACPWWLRLAIIIAMLITIVSSVRRAWRALRGLGAQDTTTSQDVTLTSIGQHFLLSFLRNHPSSVLSTPKPRDTTSWGPLPPPSLSTPPPLTQGRAAESKPPSQSSTDRRSRGEIQCKSIAESFFNKPFKKCRPEFLRNPITQERLELDLYNDELRLAIEFHGQQHYFYSKFYHSQSKDKFQNQQYRDFLKRDLCRQHRIHLIVVPFSIGPDDMEPFLHREFDRFLHLRNVYVPDEAT